ncbi:MAG: phenylacetate-CoA oxygenase subunit PaaJ [Gammaproteobacteria bacterium]|nr:phenylacetate-CoA oxygenase subunit PaaJ [Gammaproteobacteria bacterium]
MVVADNTQQTTRLYELLSKVVDPEIPVLTLQDLGVLRDITVEDDEIKVTITPTYAGCPALETMRADIETTLAQAGFPSVTVKQSLSPAWTTDWMSEAGRKKLFEYGIAPPAAAACGRETGPAACPQCGSTDTQLVSEFGSTACKALHQCQDCREPFDYFKCI